VASTGRETTIQLPPPAPRARGLLVDVAVQLAEGDTSYQGHDRLGQGVQHTPWGCEPLRTGNLDCSADYLINGSGPALDAEGDLDPAAIDEDKTSAILSFDSVVTHPAFKVVDGLKCSTLSFPDANSESFTGMTGRVLRRMRTLMSAALMGELVSGWASSGPSLSSEAEVLTASTGISKAAERIEAHLAASLQGNAGVVYIPPSLLHLAVNIDWVRVEGGALHTVTGHKVVADAGHDGKRGPTDPANNVFWLFASADVCYRVSDTNLLGDGSETLDLYVNVRERLAEAYAQLAFDPCAVAATAVTIA
jgi:hypothetical protein